MDNAIINGFNYQLPTKTLSIIERIDSLMQIEEQYEKRQIKAVDCFTAEYQFIVDILGEASATQALGTDDVNEVDINEVSIAVIKILNAYSEKVEKAKFEKQMQVMNDPKIKQALEIMKSSNKIPNQQRP